MVNINFLEKKNQVENISMAFDCDVHRNNHEKCWKMKAHQWKSGKRCEWQGRIRRLKIQENKKTTYKSFIQIHCSIRWTIIKLSDSSVLRLSKKIALKSTREEIGKKNQQQARQIFTRKGSNESITAIIRCFSQTHIENHTKQKRRKSTDNNQKKGSNYFVPFVWMPVCSFVYEFNSSFLHKFVRFNSAQYLFESICDARLNIAAAARVVVSVPGCQCFVIVFCIRFVSQN